MWSENIECCRFQRSQNIKYLDFWTVLENTVYYTVLYKIQYSQQALTEYSQIQSQNTETSERSVSVWSTSGFLDFWKVSVRKVSLDFWSITRGCLVDLRKVSDSALLVTARLRWRQTRSKRRRLISSQALLVVPPRSTWCGLTWAFIHPQQDRAHGSCRANIVLGADGNQLLRTQVNSSLTSSGWIWSPSVPILLTLSSIVWAPRQPRNRTNGSSTIPPYKWWQLYCNHLPELQSVAVRVLSQVGAASICERNWSVHGLIHSKERYSLNPNRAIQLVFIHQSIRLLENLNDPHWKDEIVAVQSDSSSDPELDSGED